MALQIAEVAQIFLFGLPESRGEGTFYGSIKEQEIGYPSSIELENLADNCYYEMTLKLF